MSLDVTILVSLEVTGIVSPVMARLISPKVANLRLPELEGFNCGNISLSEAASKLRTTHQLAVKFQAF